MGGPKPSGLGLGLIWLSQLRSVLAQRPSRRPIGLCTAAARLRATWLRRHQPKQCQKTLQNYHRLRGFRPEKVQLSHEQQKWPLVDRVLAPPPISAVTQPPANSPTSLPSHARCRPRSPPARFLLRPRAHQRQRGNAHGARLLKTPAAAMPRAQVRASLIHQLARRRVDWFLRDSVWFEGAGLCGGVISVRDVV